MAIGFPPWTGRAALAFAGALIALFFIFGWLHANAIRSDLLIPKAESVDFDLVVERFEAGRVVVPRTAESDRQGIWGLEGADAYAQMSTIVRVTDTTVERGARSLLSELVAGDAVRVDPDAFAGDPETAHGLTWEQLRIPSDIGPHDGWFVDGRRATWVIFVHGQGDDRLEESLRVIPSLVEQGFPVLAITIRNDVNATSSESGLRYWGLEEWRDLDAAVELGVRKGAKDFVVFGSGYGASIVSMFLHESSNVDFINGVVFESPVLDIEQTAVDYARERGTPPSIAWVGRRLVALRFGMDWGALDQMSRASEFDVPILLLYGAKDPVTDVGVFEDFADAIPHLVIPQRFEQGGHTDLWNVDSERYEAAIAEFLLQTAGPE
jgi:pimeloyl-ACP methyl ester carboxylesterase